MTEASTIERPDTPTAPAVVPAVSVPATPPATVETPAPTVGSQPTPGTSDVPDWRKEMAGDDEKALKRLERFTDQKALLKSWLEADAALSKRAPAIPGADAPDDVKAEFAKAIGVPADPKEYKYSLPEGMEALDEQTKAVVDDIVSTLHKRGGFAATPETVQAAVDIVLGQQDARIAELRANAVRVNRETQAAFKTEWGSDYGANVTFSSQAAVGIWGEKADSIVNLVLEDGSLLGDHPEFLRGLAVDGRTRGEDPNFVGASLFNSKTETLEAEKKGLMDLRYSKNSADRDRYARESAPGGRLHVINAALSQRRN